MTPSQFSKAWKRSIKPSKQRKYLYEAPLHIKQKLFHAHLSTELRKKYGRRGTQVRRGDTVKVMRGKFVQRQGKASQASLKQQRVFVEGIEIIKKDGTKIPYPLHPSNLLIVDLELSDKKRKKHLESKVKERK